jgi:hypothetical protein
MVCSRADRRCSHSTRCGTRETGDAVKSSGSRPDRRRLLAAEIIVCLFLLSALFPADADATRVQTQTESTPGSAASELQVILNRAAEYCDRLSRSVLNYVCRERVEEWVRPEARPAFPSYGHRSIFVGPEETYKHVYDYQLIRDRTGSIRENRTLLKENGKDVRVSDVPLKMRVFTHAYVVMGPVGLLSRERQAGHDYRIVREEKVAGEPAWVVEAVPKSGLWLQHLFGTIWLRKKDAGILKIQWNPSSIENYKGVEETAERLGMMPDILLTSEYAFEKNGIRFPSRYTVKEIYRRGKAGRRFRRSETDVVYDQYKFFTVETKVEF